MISGGFVIHQALSICLKLLLGFVFLSLVACSSQVPIFVGERKDPVEPVQAAPETFFVTAPPEDALSGELVTLVKDGKALQYYALEPAATKNIAFLTFDDFGSGRNLNEILAVLDSYGAKGTFFINCRYLDPGNALYSETYLRWMRRLQRNGHTIANHSYSHLSEGTYWYNYYRDNPVILPGGKISPPPN